MQFGLGGNYQNPKCKFAPSFSFSFFLSFHPLLLLNMFDFFSLFHSPFFTFRLPNIFTVLYFV